MSTNDPYKEWRGFETTDPANHNPDEFVYLVHGLASPMVRAMQNITAINMRKDEKIKPQEIIDLMRNPNDVHKKPIISASLIGKGKIDGQDFEALNTWSNVGLILKVPIQNILRSGTSDLGSNFINPAIEIEKYKDKYKGSPIDLLKHTFGSYNEVVIQGETEYGKVEVSGVFLNEYSSAPTEEEIKQAHLLEYITGMPLITIPKKEIKLEDKPIHIEKNEWDGKISKISFTRDNREYYCNLSQYGGLTWGLYATGDYGASFMKEDDAQTFFDELENLPSEDKEKYSEILALIPSQYALCKEYIETLFSDTSKKEQIKKKISDKNYIIEQLNLEEQKDDIDSKHQNNRDDDNLQERRNSKIKEITEGLKERKRLNSQLIRSRHIKDR